jgi:C1A family cysteine protease
MPSKGLGFLIDPLKTDLRRHMFQARRALPDKLAGVDMRHWNPGGPAWDQGNTSQCVAYSWLKMFEAGPIKNAVQQSQAEGYYRIFQQNDEWPGENYEGTSNNAAARILQREGKIGDYFWADDVETAAKWIINKSPIIFGTIWTSSMFYTDPKHFIMFSPADQIVGGHAYIALGVNLKIRCPDSSLGAFRICNSWGPTYGEQGKAWLPFSTARILLRENGEIACPTEIKWR